MTHSMILYCPSVGGHDTAVTTWRDTMTKPRDIVIDDITEGEGAGFTHKLQRGWLDARDMKADVIAYFHSDLFILEHGWDERVLKEFDDPSVAVVSFGGSLRHGDRHIYKVPYDYRQLVRSPFLSNMSDAEVHGARETGERDVAVIDSFAMIIRRTFLDTIKGWPVEHVPPSHGTDYWISLMARRLRMRIRMVGVKCQHLGGAKNQFDYGKWIAATKWKTDDAAHKAVHRWLYEEFRDVLPWGVE